MVSLFFIANEWGGRTMKWKKRQDFSMSSCLSFYYGCFFLVWVCKWIDGGWDSFDKIMLIWVEWKLRQETAVWASVRFWQRGFLVSSLFPSSYYLPHLPPSVYNTYWTEFLFCVVIISIYSTFVHSVLFHHLFLPTRSYVTLRWLWSGIHFRTVSPLPCGGTCICGSQWSS